jgi:hypothetical protein
MKCKLLHKLSESEFVQLCTKKVRLLNVSFHITEQKYIDLFQHKVRVLQINGNCTIPLLYAETSQYISAQWYGIAN